MGVCSICGLAWSSCLWVAFFPVRSCKIWQQETKGNHSFLSFLYMYLLSQQDCVLLERRVNLELYAWKITLTKSYCIFCKWHFSPNIYSLHPKSNLYQRLESCSEPIYSVQEVSSFFYFYVAGRSVLARKNYQMMLLFPRNKTHVNSCDYIIVKWVLEKRVLVQQNNKFVKAVKNSRQQVPASHANGTWNSVPCCYY